MRISTLGKIALWAIIPTATLHAQMTGPAMEQKIADAKPGDVRVLVTGAIFSPIEATRQQAQQTVGKRLVIEYGSARGNLKSMLLAGSGCEVALLLPDVERDLVAQNRLDPKQYKIASVLAGFALKGNPAEKLDVSSKEGIKTGLVNAAAVRYSPTGAAHDTVDKILDTLDIRASIKDASTQSPAEREKAAQTPLSAGQYEITILPVSEILSNKSLTNLGTVIPELQVPAVIDASICRSAADRTGAEALIKFLQGSAFESALQASGMTH